MKAIVIYVLLMLAAVCVKAQRFRIYLNDKYQTVADSAAASSKIILSKYAEDTTLWSAVQLSMDNRVMVEGVYKDKGLAVPHGPFKYYDNTGQTPYLKTTGYFFNGQKFATWTDYSPNGNKRLISTYRGNVLNGPYVMYALADTLPVVTGQYLKGQKDGEWVYRNVIDTYRNGEKIASVPNEAFERQRQRNWQAADRIKAAGYANAAKEPAEFIPYMRKKLDFFFRGTGGPGMVSLVIQFTVNTDGKLTDGIIIGKDNMRYSKRIAEAIDGAPNWKPAQRAGTPVMQKVTYTFTEDRAVIETPKFDF